MTADEGYDEYGDEYAHGEAEAEIPSSSSPIATRAPATLSDSFFCRSIIDRSPPPPIDTIVDAHEADT